MLQVFAVRVEARKEPGTEGQENPAGASMLTNSRSDAGSKKAVDGLFDRPRNGEADPPGAAICSDPVLPELSDGMETNTGFCANECKSCKDRRC